MDVICSFWSIKAEIAVLSRLHIDALRAAVISALLDTSPGHLNLSSAWAILKLKC